MRFAKCKLLSCAVLGRLPKPEPPAKGIGIAAGAATRGERFESEDVASSKHYFIGL